MNGPTSPRFPDFIVIGAIKAATTWTAHQLRQHPSIYIPGPEPHFFSTEYQRGSEWYASLFADAGPHQLIGEKSADYLSHPEAAQRIARMLPDARLIVLLRNPIERAYSDYCMLLRRGTVTAEPERYLDTHQCENPRFLENGLYAKHLTRYLDHFPREQILTVLHEDVLRTPKAVLAKICAHIEIEPRISPEGLSARLNDSKTPVVSLGLRRAVRPIKGVVQQLRGLPLFGALRDAVARPMRYPPLADELRLGLADYYRSDIEHLERIIERDIRSWLCNDVENGDRKEQPCPHA